ncbi:phosphate signaling complex protein PhoU [Neisseria animalis]|uniref:Phosphate-specific transport system accessory protein PhoU n=1 Tax=Neisseria animalis TaxID=492 RepID=A0A5P3MUZ2_NEIAN|nr:phosphate signaling complex protein PhoU [Neisseria animalis]QEY24591.1 phosphate transport system regulatory protein PhoU [Neisseria animalis]ROW32996.1 phosphate signaling complex protein PhoU [Neisseria animalis]VEE07435.1 Phosphate transport system protein phoU [Neisseria animalis]
MAEHISSHFHQELEQVRTDVLGMGGLVEQQLVRTLEALGGGNREVLAQIVQNDETINALSVAVDDDCQTILVRRQPTAGDLRLVLAVSRMITDLERMGDEIKKIAQHAANLMVRNNVGFPQLYDTARLLEMTAPMLKAALDAFARLDAQEILRLNESDKLLDLAYRNQSRTLLTYMMEDPHFIGTGMELMLMNKAAERIGDHAKNIGEHIVYLVRGIDVRHMSYEEMEKGI